MKPGIKEEDIKYFKNFGIIGDEQVGLIRPEEVFVQKIKEVCPKVNLAIGDPGSCDIIFWWLDERDLPALVPRMHEIEEKIPPSGSLWLILPKKEVQKKRGVSLPWNEIQQAVLKTSFVDNKVVSIDEERYGTRFVIRRG